MTTTVATPVTRKESASTSTIRENLEDYLFDDSDSDEGGHELQGCAMRDISLEMEATGTITLQLETIYIFISERNSKCIWARHWLPTQIPYEFISIF
jgi:hypothetical protein